jgi:hypothetical protein
MCCTCSPQRDGVASSTMFSPDEFAGIISRQAHKIYYVHAGGAMGMIWFDAIFLWNL